MNSKVYPVIHAQEGRQVQRNIDIAIDAGVAGVFLINHDISMAQLRILLSRARIQYPDLWIGVNYLGAAEQNLPDLTQPACGLWMDGVPTVKLPLSIPVLGGVGFKYQYTGLTIEEEVARALPLVDVLVTSGSGTGYAAEPNKVAYIKSLAPDTPLGLASGLTPENVGSYLPFVDWLLVATGVGRDFYNLCPDKLGDFVAAVKSQQP